MSTDEARTRVWNGSRAPAVDRLVLLAVAEFVDERGVTVVSRFRLAQMTALTARRVSRCLGNLVRFRELLEIERDLSGDKRAFLLLLPPAPSPSET